MDAKKSKLSLTMNWGLMLGLALIVFHLVQYMMDIYKAPLWATLVNYAIIIAGIVWGQIKCRDELNGGYISYGSALGTGVMVSLFSSIVFAFYFIILTKLIDTGYMDKVLETVEEAYIEAGLSDEQIETAMGMVQKFMSPFLTAISTIFSYVFMGTIISLITSIFIKREEPVFKEE